MNDMYRNELHNFQGRVHGNGQIKKFGLRKGAGSKILTVLLVDIDIWNEEKQVFIDHAWIGVNKQVDISLLKVGSVIDFAANITEYAKGLGVIDNNAYGLRKFRVKQVLEPGKGCSAKYYLQNIVNRDTEIADYLQVV